MTTPFSSLNDIATIGAYIEETLPTIFVQPLELTTKSVYNDRIDLMALRVYGTNHEVALRTLIWGNDWSPSEALRIWPEGEIIKTPQIAAVYFTREQSAI